MTEIPEHLLKRSQERRAAAGLSSPADGTPASAASSAPALVTPNVPIRPAAPVFAAPAPLKPVPAVVMAAQSRRKIPIWAMPVVVFLPLWLWMYVLATQKPPVKVTGPLKEGAVVFNNCAACHAADGSGGAGYPLYNGSLVKTFPKIEDQINYVYNGSASSKGWKGKPYGDPARGRIGGNRGPMPAWGEKAGGALTDAQMVAAICHERYGLGGVDAITAAKVEYVKEAADWCSADGVKWRQVEEKGIVGAGVKLEVGPQT